MGWKAGDTSFLEPILVGTADHSLCSRDKTNTSTLIRGGSCGGMGSAPTQVEGSKMAILDFRMFGRHGKVTLANGGDSDSDH